MKRFAENAGLEWVTEEDSDTMEPVTPDSERILCVVREKAKKVPRFMEQGSRPEGEADDH